MKCAKDKLDLTVIILTFNEEMHIERALKSVAHICENIIIVDSGSSDRTVELAENFGAKVLENPFINQAEQFNWALTQLSQDTGWVLRLDADEYLTSELCDEITRELMSLPASVSAVALQRRVKFLKQDIKWGGLFPVPIVRLFRYGKGFCENRWMDEHIVVDGDVAVFEGDFIDENLKPLSWWVEKHNMYANREAIEQLNLEFNFLTSVTAAEALNKGKSANTKRWIKTKVYSKLPANVRAGFYFLYRFILRLGFLDKGSARAYHILQGFWYRYLIELKVAEVKRHMHDTGDPICVAIEKILGLDVANIKVKCDQSSSLLKQE
jgi:glycosyltransferase involved in cell wall biosynthesis